MLNLLYLAVEWLLRVVPEQVIMIQLIVYRPMNDTQVQFLLRSNGHILKQQIKRVMVVSLFNISQTGLQTAMTLILKMKRLLQRYMYM